MPTSPCPYCSEDFTSGLGALEHLSTVHAVEYLICDRCNLAFDAGHRCSSALVRHLRTWRMDHTPNGRDYYDVPWATFNAALEAWWARNAELLALANALAEEERDRRKSCQPN